MVLAGLFKPLAHAIQRLIRTGKPPYPEERTLLASGVLDAAMHSRAEGKGLATSHLEFGYRPVDYRALRETGASWKVVTEGTPVLPCRAGAGSGGGGTRRRARARSAGRRRPGSRNTGPGCRTGTGPGHRVRSRSPGSRGSAGLPLPRANLAARPTRLAILPQWASSDLVVWYVFAHNHVPRPEDWPVMPVCSLGFHPKPDGFFERNPAIDLPPPK